MMSVLRRPVLLISAVATILIPGTLGAFAVLQHESALRASARAAPAAAGSGAQASSRQGSGDGSDGLPPAGLAGDGQGLQGAMRVGAAASVAAARSQELGMRLLREAANSGTAISYEGVEVISDVAVGGNATIVATVWHRGGITVTQTVPVQGASAQAQAAAPAAAGQPDWSYDSDVRQPEGVFGVTTTLVSLLAKNYIAVYQGDGTAAGRSALIVAVRRADGSLAAQFWLDKQTMLPLRKDVFDTHAHLVSDERFVKLRFGSVPPPVAGQGGLARAAASAWTAVPAPAAFLKKLNGHGWYLPGTLPGNLELYAAAVTSTSSGQVVDLGFSDGLFVISLFVQRGTLPARMPQWQQVRIGGHSAYVAGHEIALSARGFVYTLVADAPVPVVDQAVSALPPESRPGVLGRIRRGLVRLMSMANPFK
jgi:hypothetical protein